MTYEEIIVSIVRILGALPVLKFAFFGSIFAVIIDLSDLFIIGNLKLGGVRNYQDLDKILDLAYMITFLIISSISGGAGPLPEPLSPPPPGGDPQGLPPLPLKSSAMPMYIMSLQGKTS